MNLQPISLICFGAFRSDILEAMQQDVAREFNVPVRTKEGFLDLSPYYDPSRRQYNGNLLLNEVAIHHATEGQKTIGLFGVDLFIPILTYIFGQAYHHGHCGIASLFRLSNERYGIGPNDKLLKERFTKEVIHELGHTYGLFHCPDAACVMHSSTYVEEIDQKLMQRCVVCREGNH